MQTAPVRVKRPFLLGALAAGVTVVMLAACGGLLGLAAARDALQQSRPTTTAAN